MAPSARVERATRGSQPQSQIRWRGHGAAGRARTDYLLLTMQVHFLMCFSSVFTKMVGYRGIEPRQPGPKPGVLPEHLYPVVGAGGIEPPSSDPESDVHANWTMLLWSA